ncbi:hypothetical protein BJ741DRAFT_625233 [Chytriomyces cf. hyalinus JEL632]|nr:hypothetical protein BJ741DRAFT_625233 [Chytriomyces cf. hyalinus JEL632]
MAQISAFEAEMLVSELASKSVTFEDIGTARWFMNHENLERLNIQSHLNVQAQCEEFVTEVFLTHAKIDFLVRDLLTIEAWKRRVFPKVLGVAAAHSIKSYMILYHEATLLNLLEILFYNKESVLQVSDLLVDVVDYCHRKMTYLNTWDETIEVPSMAHTEQQSLLKSQGDLEFAIAVSSLSIFRYITDACSDVPLDVLTRILNVNEMICTCVFLIENAPWIQKSGLKKKYSRFEAGAWKDVEDEEMQRLGKVEAQVWLALYNLLLDAECRRKLIYTDHNKAVILRLRSYVEPILVDQLPMLAQVQRHLDELLIMDVPTSIEKKALLIEQVPALSSEIMSKCNVPRLSARFTALIQDETNGAEGMSSMALAKSMAAMYDLDNLDSLLEDPKCGKCGRLAENRCSKCKSEWYCNRQCQVQSWQKHKSICALMEESNAFKENERRSQQRVSTLVQEL